MYWGDVSVWFNTGETGSPGSLSFPSATARQKDRSTRFVHRSNWIHSSLFQSQFYASFNRIGLDYLEPAFDIRSVSDVDVFNVSYALRFKPGKSYQIRFRTGYDNTNIISTDFNLSNVNRYYVQTNGLFAISRRVNLYPSLRFDSYSEFDHAISYGFGANLDIIKDKLYVLANINKNYAPPTLNDLYWPGFGNPDLKPETAIKSDVGVRFVSRNLTYDVSLFSSSTDNGILWWPDSNGKYSPNNVNEITSRGISTAMESNFDIGVISTTMSSSLTWLNAQYRQRIQDGSLEGNRVVYSPAFRSGNEVRFQTKSVGVSMNHHYTSSRPVNDDNSIILPSVHLFDATAFYATKISNFNLRIAMSVQNMTNEFYQLIYGYPMPGRSWNFSLRFSF
jgi:outer membrane cobalamin receptor